MSVPSDVYEIVGNYIRRKTIERILKTQPLGYTEDQVQSLLASTAKAYLRKYDYLTIYNKEKAYMSKLNHD